jgi:hypothetical protein
MKIEVNISKSFAILIVVGLFLIAGALVVQAAFNPNMPWHALQQVSLSDTDMTSVDVNENKQIDKSDYADNADRVDGKHYDDIIAAAGGTGGGGTYKRIFATSTVHNGNFGGLSGADAYCQQRADAAGLEGTWKALLSTTSVAAWSRIGYKWDVLTDTAGSWPLAYWKIVSGTTVTNANDLWDNGENMQVAYNEFGDKTFSAPGNCVWSATSPVSGGYYSVSGSGDCSGWTSTSGSAVRGVIGGGGAGWLASSIMTAMACTSECAVYCVEQ